MRKFTKEISVLLASAAVVAVVYASAAAASSEQMEQTSGVMSAPDETVETTTEEYFAGGLVADPSEEFTEPTEEPTTEEEIPPLGGVPLPPDEFIEPTTEEELPPLAGDVAPADGDINGDGSFGISDVVLLQKWLLSVPDTHLANWWAADLNYDNRLDVFDLCLMKSKLIEKQGVKTPITVFGMTPSKTGVDDFTANFSAHKCVHNGDRLYNITPTDITDKYGFRIFKCDYCCESFLEYKGNVYQLGSGFGGLGTTSFAAADLNHDGYYELYFAFSSGSGLHTSDIGYFDTATSEVSFFKHAYWENDIAFNVKDRKLEVCEATFNLGSFVDINAKPLGKIGEIAVEDGTIVFRSITDEVFSQIISLCADDIDHVTLTAYPLDKSVQLTKEQINEMLILLKDVTLYKEDNSYNEYNGQWMQFDIALNSGKEISLAEFNPFFIINRNGYRAEYGSCQALSDFANSIIKE